MDEHLEERRRLNEILRNSPVHEILGLVWPMGASGLKAMGEEQRVAFHFVAWHYLDGPVRHSELRLEGDAEKFGGVKRVMSLVRGDAIIRVRARIPKDDDSSCKQAWLEAIDESEPDDAQLMSVRSKLIVEKQHEDNQFGVLTYDRGLKWYIGETDFAGQRIKIHLEASTDSELVEAIEGARVLWGDQQAWLERCKLKAVEDLLDLKNESWLGPGESPATAASFVSALRVDCVNVNASGAFGIDFDAGDLFWGHAVVVEGSVNGGPTLADIG